MPKFASFDATKTPSPVTGWYDTDEAYYPTLPDHLFELTEGQWSERLTGFWAVSDGKLIEVPFQPRADDSPLPAPMPFLSAPNGVAALLAALIPPDKKSEDPK